MESFGHQSLCTCCDIISRMANEMQSLFHDMEILLEQQIVHQTMQGQYNQLLLELKDKIDQISIRRYDENEDYESLEDFETFVKGVWKKINKYLDKERKSAKFYSAKRGIPISVIAEKLIDFCFHSSFTYKNIFLHQHCIEQFNTIYSQLTNVVFPEVQYSDDFEQSQMFVQTATPCLKNLLKIVDLFICDHDCGTVDSLCTMVIQREPKISQSIHLLECMDIFTTSLGEGVPRFKYLYDNINEMANYILRLSAMPKRTPPTPQRLAGILNSAYMDCTHPANMSPKIYHVQINHFPGQRVIGSQRRRIRFPEDTSPIRVPRLQIQPFPY